MEYRQLGRTSLTVSTVSFGAWAIGGTWGPVDDAASMAALHAAVDAGVNFIDTADVYGDGRSERLVARLRRERAGERIYVATKAGRRLPTQTREGYTRENLNAWVDRSLQNLGTDKIDLSAISGLNDTVPQVVNFVTGTVAPTTLDAHTIDIVTSGGNTTIYANAGGATETVSTGADIMQIQLTGVTNVTSSDFVLHH